MRASKNDMVRPIAGLVLGCAMAAAAHAQVQAIPPGAISSELLRQQQRERERLDAQQRQQDPARVLEVPRAADPTVPADDSLRFTLNALVFSDSAILSRGELEAIAQPYLGREIGFAELKDVVSAVNRRYDERGYATARAVLPAQRIEGGRVRIELVEGRVGEVKVEGLTYMRPGFVRERLDLPAGEVIDPQRLEAELSRYNRLYASSVTAALQPGQRYGLTDVYVTVSEPPRNSLDVFVNNHGYDATGEAQAGLMFRHYGALGGDDVFSLFAAGSRGSAVGSLSYDAPVNRRGTRAGVRLGKSRAEVVRGPFAALDSRSDSDNAEVFLSHPLWSNADWLLTGYLGYGYQRTTNHVSGVFLNENKVEGAKGEISALYLTPGTSLRLGLGYRRANSELLGTPSTAGFDIWSGNWQASRNVGRNGFVSFSGAWQHAHREGLPSSQLFQIGGATTVRGYRQGELAGDGGVYGSVQANYRVDPRLTAFAFYDFGRIDASFIQPEKLESVGVGFSWQFSQRVSGEVTVGRPLLDVRPDQDHVRVNAQIVLRAF
ncbi:ShlB/FhaC/HecB family hemolysin secretion/activation protein [Pseudorhodoferax sp.]|uniref:ShlB/FhaC/HecB family hemolysin secretion/activation protein n=1 Tax=Pseudorhodoferax sp. TaxID=1993553 RepID=UPI0039E2D8E8